MVTIGSADPELSNQGDRELGRSFVYKTIQAIIKSVTLAFIMLHRRPVHHADYRARKRV